jgi:hypothetical protein
MDNNDQMYSVLGATKKTNSTINYDGKKGYEIVRGGVRANACYNSMTSLTYPIVGNEIAISDSSSETSGLNVVRLDGQEMVKVCIDVYEHVGIVRNVIDLISDFAADGVEITHPSKSVKAFWTEWVKIINLKDRVERIANTLLKTGFCVVKRENGVLNVKDRSINNILKRTESVPTSYKIINPIRISIQKSVANEDNIIYSLLNSSSFLNDLGTKSNSVVPINEDENYYIANYKKDDWMTYPRPFHYAALNDILQENVFMKMDRITANNTINQIRIWKIGGELKNGKQILPSAGAYAKLATALENAPKGGTMDLLWDSMIELDQTETNVDKILNPEKYKSIKAKILEDFGIAEVLINGTGDGSYSNQYLSVKSLVEKIEYVREIVLRWIEREVEYVSKKFNFKQSPIIRFKDIDLGDETNRIKLIMDLMDRKVISKDEMLSMLNQSWDVESIKIAQEAAEEETNDKIKMVGPYSPKDDLSQEPTGKIGGDGRPANQPGDKSQKEPRTTKPQGGNTFYSNVVLANSIYDNVKNVISDNYLTENGVNNVKELEQCKKDELDNVILGCFFSSLDKDVLGNDKEKIDIGFNKYKKALEIASNGQVQLDKKLKRDIAISVWIDINGEQNG